MSMYDEWPNGIRAWQEEIYAEARKRAASPSVAVSVVQESVNMTAPVAGSGTFLHLLWISFSKLLQLLLLFAMIYLIWSSVKLHRVYLRPLHKRIKYVFEYNGPDHESLTAQIDQLTKEKTQISASLKKARNETSVLNEYASQDAATISHYETTIRELEVKSRRDTGLISRYNRQVDFHMKDAKMVRSELVQTKRQRDKALIKCDVSIAQHQSAAQHQLEIAAMKEAHAEALRITEAAHREAMNVATFKIADLENKFAQHRSATQYQSEMTAIKEAHAKELRAANAEHRRAMDAAKSKFADMEKEGREDMGAATIKIADLEKKIQEEMGAATMKITDLEKKLQSLESSVQEQSEDGVSLPKLETDSVAASAVLRDTFSKLADSQRENQDKAAKLAESSIKLLNLERENKKLADALSQSETKDSGAALANISAQLEVSWREKGELVATVLRKISELEETSSELEETSSKLKSSEEEKAKVEANLLQKTSQLAASSSKLEASEEEKAKVDAALLRKTTELADTSSRLHSSEQEKAKVEATLRRTTADLADASSKLKASRQDKEKVEADLKDVEAKLKEASAALEKASSDLKTLQQNCEKREAVVNGLQEQIRDWQDHKCDHSICQQQMNEQKAETQAAKEAQHEASIAAKQASDETKAISKELGSLQQEFKALSLIHDQCKQEPAEKSALGDDMDVDDPRIQALEERLEAAKKEVAELKLQNEKFLEALRRNGDGADVDGDSPMDDAEGRIREKIEGEFKEERGAFSTRIRALEDAIKKKDEQLKSNNVSKRLQDELKAANVRAGKLEYDLSIERAATISKANTPKTAPIQMGPTPAAPNAASDDVNQLKRDVNNAKLTAKRLNKETKAAKENYERVLVMLDKKDPEASKEFRNVEKVRAELQAEIERLGRKIQDLEAGRGEPPAPPASDNPAPESGGQGSDGGKRAREDDEEGEAEGEPKKKLRE